MTLSRRRFLSATTVAASVALFTTACTGDDDTGTGTGAHPDLDLAAAAAGLERLVVDTYMAVGAAAVQGRFGAAVAPAVVEFLRTAGRQHMEHLDAWNGLLAGGGRPAVSTPDADLKHRVDAAAGRLTDIPGAATLALRLEDYSARTYLDAIPRLQGQDFVRTAAQIVVVDQQHQAVLRYVLGLYPVGSGVVRDTTDFAPSGPTPEVLPG